MTKYRILCLSLAVLFVWQFLTPAAASAQSRTVDESFVAKCDGTTQNYVAIYPDGFKADQPCDLLIALHGHGSDRWQFVKTDFDEARSARDAASARRMIYVSPDYRAKTSWMGPKAEADLVQIIEEVKSRAKIGKTIICGGSMGGSSSLTFTALHPELIDGVVSMNGTANHLEYENFQDAIGESFGGTKAQLPLEYKKRSAEYWPERLSMPIAITAGGKDTIVPPQSVLRLAGVLKKLQPNVLLIYREEGEHRTFYDDAKQAFDFVLDKTLQSPSKIVPMKVAKTYSDGRPVAKYRLDAEDAGVILRHGDGPEQCDQLGARDPWVYQASDIYYLHYDAAGPKGWLCSLATSKDLTHWTKKGPVLDLGKPGEDDSASASYGTTYFDGSVWHMFYLGTPHVSPAPDQIPMFPYLTRKAKGNSPAGPWSKQKGVIPFQPTSNTYYSATASPGQIIKQGDEYLQFFSASTDNPCKRTLSIARTKDLDGPWNVDPQPIVSQEEQVENSSLYFEEANKTWFLFTNHIGVDQRGEYTDAVWVYWTQDLNHWNAEQKAVVLDGGNCKWSTDCIGLPSVVKFGNRLAVFYDAPGGKSVSHMQRDLGLAWLNLPLTLPATSEQK
jgi:pimeloyl-ACP methyl ester carboxylesterase/predicted GH43/DUF377 family glycosyl hydrolase